MAARKQDANIIIAIESLVSDKVPSVRFLVTTELFRFSSKAPEDFWRLAEHIAEHETNQVVQEALCHTLERVASTEVEKTAKVLGKLLSNNLSLNEDSKLLETLIPIMVGLAIALESSWALETISTFLANPIQLARPLGNAAHNALSFVKPTSFDSPRGSEVADRAIAWLGHVVDAAGNCIKELRAIPDEKWTEVTRSQLKDVYNVIDEVVMRLYFNAGIRDSLGLHYDEPPITKEQQKIFYFKIKPLLEQVLAFSLDKESGVMFAPTAQYFMRLLNGVLGYDPKGVLHLAAGVAESSEPTGYNLDSLAVTEVVNLAEAILADHRDQMRDGESLRDLLNLLDLFAKTGWPSALRLVWRLDEIFR